MKTKSDFIQIVQDALVEHDFTWKVILLALLNVVLPLIWPVIAITILMTVDLWAAYQANRRLGLKFNSKGLGKTLKKWVEFMMGMLVTVIVDLIFIEYLGMMGFMLLTNVFMVFTALRELKSISENFSGLGLSRALSALIKFISKKNTYLYEAIDEELKKEKSKLTRAEEAVEELKKREKSIDDYQKSKKYQDSKNGKQDD